MKIFAITESFERQRLEKGFSAKSLAKAVEVGDTYMSQIENARVSISPPLAAKISGALSCEFDMIFVITDRVATGE
jgi:transcriptional regulator with XRE-family HTH domain